MTRALVVALLAIVALASFARAEDVDANELVDRLARVRRALEDEVTTLRETGDADLDRVRRAGEKLERLRVRVPGRDPIPADPNLARDLEELERDQSLNGREEKLERLTRKYSSLEREARRARERMPSARAPAPSTPDEPERPEAPPKTTTPDKAREALDRVLAGTKYRKRTANEAEGFGVQERLDSWLQRIENAWTRFLQPPATTPTTPAWLKAIGNFIASIMPASLSGYLVWILGLVVLIVAWVWYRRRRRPLATDESRPLEGADPDAMGAAPARREETYSEEWWRTEARALAQRGEHRGAVRALYTGVLLLLQRAGRLKFDKGKTNWEHVRDLRKNDRALAKNLEPLTRTFDLVWYGQKPIEKPSFDAFWSQAHGFASEAGLVRSEEPSPAPPSATPGSGT